MNKSFLYLVFVLILLVSVMAASSNVMILKLNYNQGNISLVNKTAKYGFTPDRRYQPINGYRAEIISVDDESLYEFRFKVPNEIFIDGTDENGDIIGGKVVLDNVNFALNVPHYSEMKELRIYSSDDEEIGKISFEEEWNLSMLKYTLIGVISIITIIWIFFIWYMHRKLNA